MDVQERPGGDFPPGDQGNRIKTAVIATKHPLPSAAEHKAVRQPRCSAPQLRFGFLAPTLERLVAQVGAEISEKRRVDVTRLCLLEFVMVQDPLVRRRPLLDFEMGDCRAFLIIQGTKRCRGVRKETAIADLTEEVPGARFRRDRVATDDGKGDRPTVPFITLRPHVLKSAVGFLANDLGQGKRRGDEPVHANKPARHLLMLL